MKMGQYEDKKMRYENGQWINICESLLLAETFIELLLEFYLYFLYFK
jgi:hypothetical protein